MQLLILMPSSLIAHATIGTASTIEVLSMLLLDPQPCTRHVASHPASCTYS
jgi:hypothetical protein